MLMMFQTTLKRSLMRTPPPSKRAHTTPVSPASPQWSRERFERVISQQTHASRVEINVMCTCYHLRTNIVTDSALVKSKAFTCVVYAMKAFIKMEDLDGTGSDWKTFCQEPVVVALVLDLDPKHQMVGAFKMAVLGKYLHSSLRPPLT